MKTKRLVQGKIQIQTKDLFLDFHVLGEMALIALYVSLYIICILCYIERCLCIIAYIIHNNYAYNRIKTIYLIFIYSLKH